jgi:hypothetical protein
MSDNLYDQAEAIADELDRIVRALPEESLKDLALEARDLAENLFREHQQRPAFITLKAHHNRVSIVASDSQDVPLHTCILEVATMKDVERLETFLFNVCPDTSVQIEEE